MKIQAIAIVLLASSLGGCGHVSAMWNKVTGHHEAGAASLDAARVSPQVCDTLRANAAAGTTADPASRQMAIDEMKRSGCPDIPAL